MVRGRGGSHEVCLLRGTTSVSIASTVAILVVLLGACGESTPEEPGAAPTATESGVRTSASVTTAAEETTSATTTATRNERGNIPKVIGERAAIVDSTGTLAEFFVDAISVGDDCTGSQSTASENGQFVTLTVRVQTYPALADSFPPIFSLTQSEIDILDPQGVRQNSAFTEASLDCLAPQDQLPYDIGPGQTASGRIVVDSQYPAGYLVVSLGGVQGGWEYSFGNP